MLYLHSNKSCCCHCLCNSGAEVAGIALSLQIALMATEQHLPLELLSLQPCLYFSQEFIEYAYVLAAWLCYSGSKLLQTLRRQQVDIMQDHRFCNPASSSQTQVSSGLIGLESIIHQKQVLSGEAIGTWQQQAAYLPAFCASSPPCCAADLSEELLR